MKPFFKDFNAQKEQILMKRCFDKLAPYVRTLPSLNDMTITSVKNSIVSCLHCRRSGINYIRNRQLKTLDKVHCPICEGSRVRSNRLGQYDK